MLLAEARRLVLLELLDQPAQWRWTSKGSDRWYARFRVGEAEYEFRADLPGHKAIVQFNMTPESAARLGVKGGIGITGTGNSAVVFSTAVSIMLDLARQFPDLGLIEYTAKEPSRRKLYARMNKVIARKLGPEWKAEGPFNWGRGELTFWLKKGS